MRGGTRPTGVRGTNTKNTPNTNQPSRPQDARHIPREFKYPSPNQGINF